MKEVKLKMNEDGLYVFACGCSCVVSFDEDYPFLGYNKCEYTCELCNTTAMLIREALD